MPLYRLLCIAAHYPEYGHIKDLISTNAKLLLDNGGAVREIRFLGTRNLPQRMRRHKNYHTIGDYWTMHFDAAPPLLSQLNDRLRTDHRVVRWTTLKLAERLPDVVGPGSAAGAVEMEELLKSTVWARGGLANLSGMRRAGRVGTVAGLGNELRSRTGAGVASLGGIGYTRERI